MIYDRAKNKVPCPLSNHPIQGVKARLHCPHNSKPSGSQHPDHQKGVSHSTLDHPGDRGVRFPYIKYDSQSSSGESIRTTRISEKSDSSYDPYTVPHGNRNIESKHPCQKTTLPSLPFSNSGFNHGELGRYRLRTLAGLGSSPCHNVKDILGSSISNPADVHYSQRPKIKDVLPGCNDSLPGCNDSLDDFEQDSTAGSFAGQRRMRGQLGIAMSQTLTSSEHDSHSTHYPTTETSGWPDTFTTWDEGFQLTSNDLFKHVESNDLFKHVESNDLFKRVICNDLFKHTEDHHCKKDFSESKIDTSPDKHVVSNDLFKHVVPNDLFEHVEDHHCENDFSKSKIDTSPVCNKNSTNNSIAVAGSRCKLLCETSIALPDVVDEVYTEKLHLESTSVKRQKIFEWTKVDEGIPDNAQEGCFMYHVAEKPFPQTKTSLKSPTPSCKKALGRRASQYRLQYLPAHKKRYAEEMKAKRRKSCGKKRQTREKSHPVDASAGADPDRDEVSPEVTPGIAVGRLPPVYDVMITKRIPLQLRPIKVPPIRSCLPTKDRSKGPGSKRRQEKVLASMQRNGIQHDKKENGKDSSNLQNCDYEIRSCNQGDIGCQSHSFQDPVKEQLIRNGEQGDSTCELDLKICDNETPCTNHLAEDTSLGSSPRGYHCQAYKFDCEDFNIEASNTNGQCETYDPGLQEYVAKTLQPCDSWDNSDLNYSAKKTSCTEGRENLDSTHILTEYVSNIDSELGDCRHVLYDGHYEILSISGHHSLGESVIYGKEQTIHTDSRRSETDITLKSDINKTVRSIIGKVKRNSARRVKESMVKEFSEVKMFTDLLSSLEDKPSYFKPKSIYSDSTLDDGCSKASVFIDRRHPLRNSENNETDTFKSMTSPDMVETNAWPTSYSTSKPANEHVNEDIRRNKNVEFVPKPVFKLMQKRHRKRQYAFRCSCFNSKKMLKRFIATRSKFAPKKIDSRSARNCFRKLQKHDRFAVISQLCLPRCVNRHIPGIKLQVKPSMLPVVLNSPRKEANCEHGTSAKLPSDLHAALGSETSCNWTRKSGRLKSNKKFKRGLMRQNRRRIYSVTRGKRLQKKLNGWPKLCRRYSRLWANKHKYKHVGEGRQEQYDKGDAKRRLNRHNIKKEGEEHLEKYDESDARHGLNRQNNTKEEEEHQEKYDKGDARHGMNRQNNKKEEEEHQEKYDKVDARHGMNRQNNKKYEEEQVDEHDEGGLGYVDTSSKQVLYAFSYDGSNAQENGVGASCEHLCDHKELEFAGCVGRDEKSRASRIVGYQDFNDYEHLTNSSLDEAYEEYATEFAKLEELDEHNGVMENFNESNEHEDIVVACFEEPNEHEDVEVSRFNESKEHGDIIVARFDEPNENEDIAFAKLDEQVERRDIGISSDKLNECDDGVVVGGLVEGKEHKETVATGYDEPNLNRNTSIVRRRKPTKTDASVDITCDQRNIVESALLVRSSKLIEPKAQVVETCSDHHSLNRTADVITENTPTPMLRPLGVKIVDPSRMEGSTEKIRDYHSLQGNGSETKPDQHRIDTMEMAAPKFKRLKFKNNLASARGQHRENTVACNGREHGCGSPRRSQEPRHELGVLRSSTRRSQETRHELSVLCGSTHRSQETRHELGVLRSSTHRSQETRHELSVLRDSTHRSQETTQKPGNVGGRSNHFKKASPRLPSTNQCIHSKLDQCEVCKKVGAWLDSCSIWMSH